MSALKVEVNQHILRGGARVPDRLIDRIFRKIEKELNIKTNETISIAFVPEKEMKRLNKKYRGKTGTTDILSFGLDEPGTLGELIISYDQATIQAKEMKHSTRDEIVFLIVHGVLHLHGHDHELPKDAKKMFRLQDKILRSLGVDSRL